MPKETVNGVTNYYGPRARFDTQAGQIGTTGAEKQLVIFFDGSNFSSVRASLPAGAVIQSQPVVEVTEAFDLSDPAAGAAAAPVINIGVSGTEGTDRIAQLSEAQAEAVGTYSVAPAGILALNTPLAAPVEIRVALGGTSPTSAGVGAAKVICKYTTI